MLCLKICLITLLYISTATAEGPYAAGGWRPQRPFNLPSDYLTPSRDIEQQRQPQQQQPIYVLEINKERVDYLGHLHNNILSSANRQPANTYLPPLKQSTDFSKVQRPPYQKPAPQFLLQPRVPQQQQKTQIFQISGTQEQQLGVERLPLRPQQKQSFAFEKRQESEPAQSYGPPSSGQEQTFPINYPDPRSLEPQQTDTELDEGKRIAIEALNAADEAYHRQEDAKVVSSADGTSEADVQEVDADDEKRSSGGYPAARATSGQYYVLGKDKQLHLVRFTTTQSDEEARTNGGFTAQLRYTPAGEINDPVFKYNSRGQLVRIVKK